MKSIAQNSDKSAIHENSLKALEPFKFKPGLSGNPGGRPKRDVASEIAHAIVENNPEAIYKAMLAALKKGNPRVFAALAERAYGKVAQAEAEREPATVVMRHVMVADLEKP